MRDFGGDDGGAAAPAAASRRLADELRSRPLIPRTPPGAGADLGWPPSQQGAGGSGSDILSRAAQAAGFPPAAHDGAPAGQPHPLGPGKENPAGWRAADGGNGVQQVRTGDEEAGGGDNGAAGGAVPVEYLQGFLSRSELLRTPGAGGGRELLK